MAVVLLPFPYAGNGFTIENLVTGDIREFGAATGGLIAAGLISVDVPAISEEIAETPAEIPMVQPKKTPHKRGR